MTEPTFFATPQAFRAWLQKHAATHTELLVGLYKLDSGRPSMTWPESVDEALCFGWIDAVRKRIDDSVYQIRFSRRKPTSVWSAININKYQLLLAQGRITPAGAQAWAHRTAAKSVIYAYEQPQTAELSVTELKRFKRQVVAWQFFENSPPGYRKTLLHWVTTAKKPETRAARLDKLVLACAASLKLR